MVLIFWSLVNTLFLAIEQFRHSKQFVTKVKVECNSWKSFFNPSNSFLNLSHRIQTYVTDS